jgi:hypothetical protein
MSKKTTGREVRPLLVSVHYANDPLWREKFYGALVAAIPQLRDEDPPEPEDMEPLPPAA